MKSVKWQPDQMAARADDGSTVFFGCPRQYWTVDGAVALDKCEQRHEQARREARERYSKRKNSQLQLHAAYRDSYKEYGKNLQKFLALPWYRRLLMDRPKPPQRVGIAKFVEF